MTWQTIRLSGQDALAERASKKLRNDELLVGNFAASRLCMEMDRVPLWRGNHVPIRQLVEDFGRYLYLPRLQSSNVLLNAIRAGLALLTGSTMPSPTRKAKTNLQFVIADFTQAHRLR